MVEDAVNMDTAPRPSRISSVEPGESLRDSLSIEIMPPLKGQGAGTLVEFLDGLAGWRPRFVSVTYHQAEKVDVTTPTGDVRRITRRKKPGSLGVCSMIRDRYDLEVLPHVICGGFSRLDSEDYLIDLDYVGMRTLLVVRGDGQMGGPFRASEGGHEHAVDLVEQVMAMNRGEYIEEVAEPATTSFRVGVGAYPEVHAEAADLEHDLQTLALKEQAGASFAITQMFFDNDAYFRFVEAARARGITMPIIPGLKVVTRRSHVERLPEIFSIRMPESLVEAVASCENDEEVRQVGIEHTVTQARELHQSGVPGIHLFTMNDLDTTRRVVSGL